MTVLAVLRDKIIKPLLADNCLLKRAELAAPRRREGERSVRGRMRVRHSEN